MGKGSLSEDTTVRLGLARDLYNTLRDLHHVLNGKMSKNGDDRIVLLDLA